MKTVLITGASRGIGLEHARRFAAKGAHVFAAVRTPTEAKELQALAAGDNVRVEILAYDAADAGAPGRLKAALGDAPLDLLFANAGESGDKTHPLGSIDAEGVLKLVNVNALAPLKLVEALTDNVGASDRKIIAFQSSRLGSIGENGSGGYYPYRISKCVVNMIAKNIAVDLKPRGVIAVALHPGWVRTRMGGEAAPVSVDESVTGQQRLLDNLSLGDSGKFYNYDGAEIAW
jgi:NAD(P)-dependent dehydrogenase (short-subunit alcohol dehydrogenase family)